MTPFQGSFGMVAQINFKLFLSVVVGWAAFVIWPSSPKWWGFGVIGILLALAAVSLLIEALRAMLKLYIRDKALAEYLAQGNKPKSSKMVSTDTLRKTGVINE